MSSSGRRRGPSAWPRRSRDREQAEFKAERGTASDVAEAQQRLEQFRLDLVTRTSDVITAERQFRNLLGLPPADNRRIIPVSPPIEARLEPDWDKSRAAMLENQPDILVARARVKQAERRDDPSLLERRKAHLQQDIHQTTHSLARFFNQIDDSYRQFRAASRVRQAAAQRLDAMRADREAGRIPVDRFLDAVGQYAAAVSTEAQYRATYNIAIVALEEAKGTLLEYDKITITEGAKGIAPATVRPDSGVRPATHERTTPAPSPIDPAAAAPGPPGPRQADAGSSAKDDGQKLDATGKTVSFHLTIGAGPRPIEIRGSFTVAPARATRQRRDQVPLRTDPAYFPAVARMTRKRVPWPGVLSTSRRPPWSWTMPWVMLRPSPVPSPTPLVVKNGSKICGQDLVGDAAAVVGHLDDDLAVDRAGADRDPPVDAVRRLDGLHGVDQQVQEDLVELGRRAGDLGQLAELLLDGDAAAIEPAPDHLEGRADRLVDVDLIDLGAVEPGEAAEVLHDVGHPLDALPRAARGACPGSPGHRPGRTRRRAGRPRRTSSGRAAASSGRPCS